LDIRHLAAPCRNVPVTFTLAIGKAPSIVHAAQLT
jgi:hypothetical protein